MPKKRYRDILEKTLLTTAALFLAVGIIALGFLKSISKENRALIVIVASLGTIVCFAGLVSLNAIWRWLRRRTWQRAISAWKDSLQDRKAPKFVLDCELSEGELRNLAIQAYSRMGYIVNRDGGEDIIRMVNPEGGIELIAWTGQASPADIPSIHALHLEMKKARAVRAYFWSPAGFTSEAIHWAKRLPIVLADPIEIGRLVDCAHEKGSPLL